MARFSSVVFASWSASSVGSAIFATAVIVIPFIAADAPKTQLPTPAAAAKTLTDKGLTKLKTTPTMIPWVLADEAPVHAKLADFRKAEVAHRAAAKKAKEEAASIAKDREALSKAEARYQEEKGYSDKPDTIPRQIVSRFRSQQEMLQALQDDLNAQVNTINTLRPKLQTKIVGEMPPSLKTAITDWMTARNLLILATLAAQSDFDSLDKHYRELADDADVAAALKALGKKNHLGSPDFEQDRKAMAAAEATALSGDVPFYREGSFDFVGALLNETKPVAVKIESVNPTTANWAPTEVLTKAGITVDPAAPSVTLTITGNGKRVIQCHQVVVPKLRIGKYVLENLKFLAMPDDAKDLGLQIGNGELKGFDQSPDLETWICKFARQDEPKPSDDKTAKPNAK
jgi:hypothetical protein